MFVERAWVVAAEHEKALTALRADADRKMGSAEADQAMAAIKAEHEREGARLTADHESALSAIRAEHQAIHDGGNEEAVDHCRSFR